MNKLIYTLMTIITISSFHANADDGVKVLGGNVTCGKWVEERKQDNASNMQLYLIAFVSGYAMGSAKNFLRNIDHEAIYIWTDNYCKSNPTDGLIRAAIVFKSEMVKKEGL